MSLRKNNNRRADGFTLIEMAAVCVVIGLIVSGILVAQNMNSAAAISAQIAQIQKYNSAVSLFQTKYGYLPGDIPNPYAGNYGFQNRGSYAGQGDGNGVIEGNCSNAAGASGSFKQGCGELPVFWQDLGAAGLIDTVIKTGVGYPSPTGTSPFITLTSNPGVKDWLPAGRIGQSNFLYLYSLNSLNYFSISQVYHIGDTISSYPGMTVEQAYKIDLKMDDGLPQSGSVTACYEDYDVVGFYPVWASGGGVQGASGGQSCQPTTAQTPSSAITCYDNSNTNGAVMHYTLSNANVRNCALSFLMQQ